MVSDVPLGAFLSGGIDSSILVAMMSRITNNVNTFSVGFGKEGSDMDESGDASIIAKFLKTNHSTVRVTGKDVKDNINKIVIGLDQPSIDGVNSFFVSQAAFFFLLHHPRIALLLHLFYRLLLFLLK